MEAQDFAALFKKKELTDLLEPYSKAHAEYERQRDTPPKVTPHGPIYIYGRKSVERAKCMVTERQAALGAYLLRILDDSSVKALMANIPPTP